MSVFFQTLQETSQLLQVTTRSTQNCMGNLYTTSPVRRTVYQSVPTDGTEKEPEKKTYTRMEAACLLRSLIITMIITDFDALRQMILIHIVQSITVNGSLSR